MAKPPDQETTMITPPVYARMEPLPRHGLKEMLGFDGYRPEDRWLWFAVRLSLVLFLIGAQTVVIAAFAKVMLSL